MSNHAFWKKKESRIARMFGSERIGAKRGIGAPDFECSWLVGEVFTQDLPKKWTQELGQAIRGAGSDQLPIAIMSQKGKEDKESIVLLRLKDFIDWFGTKK